jgi:hypothetical protein
MKEVRMANKKKMMNLQLLLGFILAIFGIALIGVSFIVPPLGIIHASVLTAIGEIFTFSGALLGLDYNYKYKVYLKDRKEMNELMSETEEKE